LSIGLLASILQAQGNLGSETKELHERALIITTQNYGSEGMNTAAMNLNIGGFYYLQAQGSRTAETKRNHLQLSVSKYKESLRIYTVVLGPDNPHSIKASSALSIMSRLLSEA
jgi:hypothetical protein